MALKGIIFSGLIGTTVTTSAAIPIAGKYGKDRVKEEIAAAETEKVGLNIQKKGLEKAKSDAEGDRIKAQSARDEAEKEQTALNKKSDSLKQDFDRWENDYKQQKAQNEKLTQELEPLKRRKQELEGQLATKNDEINRAKEQAHQKVVNHINERLADLGQFDFWNQVDRDIYDKGVMKWIAGSTNRPWDTEPNKWNCQQKVDSQAQYFGFGIAYCVL